ncbi:MAG: hypoxanthine phosphoribosyltransferase [Dehalococcoidia bacterium]|nr:hypoxanthine phosphoribosyltransferase [Dehalococcoidia bacterium]
MSEHLSLLIHHSDIEQTVSRIAAQISRDYEGRHLLVVGILKGAFIFMADLVRQITIPIEVDFVTVSSYGSGTSSSRRIRLLQDMTVPVRDKDVLIVEDIVDSGYTLSYVMQHATDVGALSVAVCALADKPSRRETPVDVSYLGFTVPDKFIVGYGLDFDNRFRYLPDIYALENRDE